MGRQLKDVGVGRKGAYRERYCRMLRVISDRCTSEPCPPPSVSRPRKTHTGFEVQQVGLRGMDHAPRSGPEPCTERAPLPLADCTPPPLPQQLFVLGCLSLSLFHSLYLPLSPSLQPPTSAPHSGPTPYTPDANCRPFLPTAALSGRLPSYPTAAIFFQLPPYRANYCPVLRS